MKLKEMIAVMQAADEGKRIEARAKGDTVWRNSRKPGWNWYEGDYRIAPEPKVVYVNEYNGYNSRAYNTAESARANHNPQPNQGIQRVAVKYIEVVDEE